MKRVLTGIKPTGHSHIGNYFGAIRPAIDMSEKEDMECFYFIADYHALTTLKTKEEMDDYTFDIACTWLACGLNPNKVVFYKQSDVPEIFELNWILNNITPKGLMNRAHAYKACVEANEETGIDKDSGVNMGLYCYPILMSADILLFDTNFVPVGLDQKQHVEIASDISKYFNKKYGKTFIEPFPIIDQNSCTLVGLDGRKMSKSYNNAIQLFTEESVLKKTISRVVTDSTLPGEPKTVDCTINKLYKLFATPTQKEAFENKLLGGISWSDAKNELFEIMNAYISPMREKYFYYQAHRDEVVAILKAGAIKAREVATNKIHQVRTALGIVE